MRKGMKEECFSHVRFSFFFFFRVSCVLSQERPEARTGRLRETERKGSKV